MGQWFSVWHWPLLSPLQADYDNLALRVVDILPELELALREGKLRPHMRRFELKPLPPEVLVDTDAVKAVVSRAQPEVVIEQLTDLPRTYTRESMSAAAAFNTRIRLEGGANVLAAAQAAGVRRYLRQSIAFWAVPGPGLADEETPLAIDASPAVAADARVVTELEDRLLGNPNIEGIALRYGFFCGPGTWFTPDGDVAQPLAVREWLPAFAQWLNAPPPPQISVEDALKASGADAVYYGIQMRGVSNAKAKRELNFQPRPLEWIVDHGGRN